MGDVSRGGRRLRVPLADLPEDGRALVEDGGLRLAVFRVGGEVFAVENACPHAGNPLVEGEVLGRTLVCAFHGWRFDLETGACLFGEEPLRRYPAEVREGAIWIDLARA